MNLKMTKRDIHQAAKRSRVSNKKNAVYLHPFLRDGHMKNKEPLRCW